MNERAIEYAFVFKCISMLGPKTILDVGTGRTALPALINSCDIQTVCIDKDAKQITANKFCAVRKDDILKPTIKTKFDMIMCVSVLEHIQQFDLAVKNMTELLNPGGGIVLTFPYNENVYIPDNYKLPKAGYGKGALDICQSFSKKEVVEWCSMFKLKLKLQERWEVFSGEFWTYGSRLPVHKQGRDENAPHQLSCILLGN